MSRFAPLALLMTAALPALAQPAPPPAPQAAPSGRQNPIQMFLNLDTNRDGRISWEEGWTMVQARFAQADANHDGGLTPEEFRSLRPGPRREPPAGERAERMQRFADARFRAADANRDGRVALDELRPMAEAMFRTLDANADNAVTPDEIPSRGRGMRRPG